MDSVNFWASFSVSPTGTVAWRRASTTGSVRWLDDAAENTPAATGFPHDLTALVEPGEDIEPFLSEHGQPRQPVDLP